MTFLLFRSQRLDFFLILSEEKEISKYVVYVVKQLFTLLSIRRKHENVVYCWADF